MKKLLLLITLVFASCSTEPVDPYADCVEGIQHPFLWEQGIIPYYFASDFPEEVKETIREGVRRINEKTPIQIVEYGSRAEIQQKDMIAIKVNPFANSSAVGREGGVQTITFSYIDEPFIAVHEFLHAAGLPHEQNIVSRDDYLVINYENMPEYYHRQYIKVKEDLFGKVPDRKSIMIYGSFKNSSNEKPVMTWKDGSTWETNKVMSLDDIENIQQLYKCEVWEREN